MSYDPRRSSLFIVLALVAAAAAAQGRGREPDGSLLTFDDLQARVAQRAPAFGGFFIDEATGSLNVYSWNRTPAGVVEVERALRAVFGETLPQGKIRILPGQYGFQELKRWHDSLNEVLSIPGVVLTDIDDAKNRLQVGVESNEIGWKVRDRLVALGIPDEAVDVVETAPMRLEAGLRTLTRPLVGALQISFATGGSAYLCTMGFNAVRAGVPGLVINSHCSGIQGGVQSTLEYQPSISSTNRIGVETVDPTYFTGAPCPVGRKCRRSDSAFVRRDSGVTATMGRIARPSLNSLIWNAIDTFRIVKEADPLVGQTVTKVGRTTGRTQGQVLLVCADLNVDGTNITQLCQTVANYGSAGGDSGSPVFRILNSPAANDVALGGIHWGAGGGLVVFSPISGIQRSTGPAELGPVTTCAAGFIC
jgi:hypothetical protein